MNSATTFRGSSAERIKKERRRFFRGAELSLSSTAKKQQGAVVTGTLLRTRWWPITTTSNPVPCQCHTYHAIWDGSMTDGDGMDQRASNKKDKRTKCASRCPNPTTTTKRAVPERTNERTNGENNGSCVGAVGEVEEPNSFSVVQAPIISTTASSFPCCCTNSPCGSIDRSLAQPINQPRHVRNENREQHGDTHDRKFWPFAIKLL